MGSNVLRGGAYLEDPYFYFLASPRCKTAVCGRLQVLENEECLWLTKPFMSSYVDLEEARARNHEREIKLYGHAATKFEGQRKNDFQAPPLTINPRATAPPDNLG